MAVHNCLLTPASGARCPWRNTNVHKIEMSFFSSPKSSGWRSGSVDSVLTAQVGLSPGVQIPGTHITCSGIASTCGLSARETETKFLGEPGQVCDPELANSQFIEKPCFDKVGREKKRHSAPLHTHIHIHASMHTHTTNTHVQRKFMAILPHIGSLRQAWAI